MKVKGVDDKGVAVMIHFMVMAECQCGVDIQGMAGVL